MSLSPSLLLGRMPRISWLHAVLDNDNLNRNHNRNHNHNHNHMGTPNPPDLET